MDLASVCPCPVPSASHLSSFPRFAKYFSDLTGAERRTLIKAYGIRFDIIVFGKVAWPPTPLRALVQTQASGLARDKGPSPHLLSARALYCSFFFFPCHL